jgi:hypothetical protein
MQTTTTRREFLADAGAAASGTWLALQLPWLAALASCARDDARDGAPFTHLTAVEAHTLRAVAARILPAVDGAPGAEEAGAAHFVDRALGTGAFADDLALVRRALAALAARDFAALPERQQDELLRRMERGPSFAALRTLVVIGTLADPSYGGNRDGAGWRLIGTEHRAHFDAPFGWYDAHAAPARADGPEGRAP